MRDVLARDGRGMPRRPGAPSAEPLDRRPVVHRAHEHDPEAVRRRRRSGDWERVGRGVYLDGAPSSGSPHERLTEVAVARIVGLHGRLTAPHWFSHDSAAILWGLPSWDAPRTTHVLHPHRRGARSDPAVSWHVGVPSARDRACILGLPVTSLERTTLDVVSSRAAVAGLVIADAALRAGADPELLAAMLDERGGARGIRRARAVLTAADAGAESPGESAARWHLLRAGLPAPSTQIRIATRLGDFWGDLGWEEWRLLVEYDGRPKYVADPEALMREKRRHDAIVESGWRVLRATKEDLVRGLLVDRVAAVLPPTIPRTARPYLQ